MNVYDFDNTIYNGDSTVDFYLFCLKKKPWIIFRFPLFTALKYVCAFQYKLQFKERFYRFFRAFPDIDCEVNEFWETHKKNIKQFYLDGAKPDDVVISASPEFLVTPMCKDLGIKTVIGSVVDRKTGKYTGKNCHGDEKVKRFEAVFGKVQIEKFFSDSYTDFPLARMARRPFIVKGDNIQPWDFNKK